MEGTSVTMQTIMTAVGDIVSSGIDWITDFCNVIVSNPLLLAFVVVAFVGLSVGLIKRIIRL